MNASVTIPVQVVLECLETFSVSVRQATAAAGTYEASPEIKALQSPASARCGERQSSLTSYAPVAAQVYRAREIRERFFSVDLFGEAAWNILLDLFMQTGKGRKVSVTSACIAARVPSTTALRWIGVLIEEGLVTRVDDPADRRRAFIELSAAARAKLDQYFKMIELPAQGLNEASV